jgi:hypothetical protein
LKGNLASKLPEGTPYMGNPELDIIEGDLLKGVNFMGL